MRNLIPYKTKTKKVKVEVYPVAVGWYIEGKIDRLTAHAISKESPKEQNLRKNLGYLPV